MCCFLHVHPTGASLDYIWSYLHRLGVACRVSELETLLEKMSVIFRQEVSGVGATIERRWHFTGYRGFSSSSAILFWGLPNTIIILALEDFILSWGIMIGSIIRSVVIPEKWRSYISTVLNRTRFDLDWNPRGFWDWSRGPFFSHENILLL